MLCPKCYGKFDKKAKICINCGFSSKEFEGATNKKAKLAKKQGKGEDVLMTSTLPPDVRKKTLLLLSIFLGYMGAQNYYVGRWLKAIYASVSFLAINISFYFQYLRPELIVTEFAWYVVSFVNIFAGINIFIWLNDIIQISLNKFKVPVYKDEFSDEKNN